MKKWICYILIVSCCTNSFCQEGKIRPYTAAELARWTFICDGLGKALPHSYKDYTVVQSKCGSFDWSERDTKGNPLTVTNKKNEPTGNRPYFTIDFKMNEDSMDIQGKSFDGDLLKSQRPDGTFDSKALEIYSANTSKFNQCHNPTIVAMVNQNTTISKTYEISTKPVKLTLPVNVFAYLYTVPAGKQMGNDADEIAYDNTNQYQDKAIIILSTKPPKVVPTAINGKGTMREDKITPTDGCEQSTTPIQNIVVEINGYEKDVRALIDKIDWKYLQSLLGK